MRTRIFKQARSLGFDAVGFTTPELPPAAAGGMMEYLANGHHGDMAWMEEKAGWRISPKTLWPEAQSVIVVGHNYAPETNPLEKLAQKSVGNISCYALNEDYHDVMKKKLKALARWLAQEFGCEVKLFVDTAPVMEKALAAQAGLGWQGKHTCLVSREFGNWLFLGSIFTTLPLKPSPLEGEGWEGGDIRAISEQDSPLPLTPSRVRRRDNADYCGSCRKCIDICSTNAFTAERKLDARKCISYLTIEHKSQIPLEFRKAIGNRIYGCDDCLAVCPWNRFAQRAQEMAYHPREALKAPLLAELLALDDAAFRTLFSKSPVKRIGRDRFVRNALVAAGNSNDRSLSGIIAPLLSDASPLVAEMARWALAELEKSPR